MEEGVYRIMDPACAVNEKGTREKNDGNEVVEEETRPPLDLEPNEVIEADDEEDWHWSSSRIWNQIFRSRNRLDRTTGQDPRRNIILTVTTL